MKGNPTNDPEISNTFKVNDQEIFLVSDPAHALKAIRNVFMNRKLYMSEKYVEQYGLSTDEINFEVLERMVIFGQERELSVFSHLSEKTLRLSVNHFKKMDVGLAMKVLSYKTSDAIRFLISNYPEEFPHYYMTTAVFIENVAEWFDIMKSRSITKCFHSENPKKFQQHYKFLEHFMEFWGSCKIHDKQRSYWDQQKSVLMCTYTVMGLSIRLVKKDGFKFFLPGRVLADAIENYFSCVRQFQKNPTPLLFKKVAKAICLIQFLRYSPNGSYEEDDSEEFLVDFEDFKSKEVDVHYVEEEEDLAMIDDQDIEALEKEDFEPDDHVEICALANIAASILAKTIHHGRSKCQPCTEAFTTSYEGDEQKCNEFLRFRSKNTNKSTFPSILANAMFLSAESLFRSRRLDLLPENRNISKKLLEMVLADFEKEFSEMNIPDCHLKVIFGRFLKARCNFWARKSNARILKSQGAELNKQKKSSASAYQVHLTRKETEQKELS